VCPPFPPILGLISRALEDPGVNDRDVRRALRADEALSLGLLRYANTAWMAQRRPARTIDQALAVVGMAGLRSIVLTQFIGAFFTQSGPVEALLWEHSVASAVATALQRSGGGPATEELYLCGLLHNAGKAALNAEDRPRYADVVARVIQTGEEFAQAEEVLLGVSHSSVGAELLREANVPPLVKHVTLHHHQPERAPAEAADVCRMLLLADAIAYRASPAWARLLGPAEPPRWIEGRLRQPGQSPVAPDIDALEARVCAELDRIRSWLGR